MISVSSRPGPASSSGTSAQASSTRAVATSRPRLQWGAPHWAWHFHAATNTLYHWEDQHWQAYQASRRPRPGTIFKKSNQSFPSLPQQCKPADVAPIPSNPTAVIFGSYSTHRLPHQIPKTQLTLPASTWDCLPPPSSKNHWAVHTVTQQTKGQDNGNNVAQAIRDGTARAVCDGSFKNGKGTAGFCMHGAVDKHQITGSHCTPGRKEDQCAYRSELGGVVGTLVTIQAVCKAHMASPKAESRWAWTVKELSKPSKLNTLLRSQHHIGT